MSIDEFGVSEKCRDQLKSAGVESVDDLLNFFQYVFRNATWTISWGECFEEVVEKLQEMKRLPKDF